MVLMMVLMMVLRMVSAYSGRGYAVEREDLPYLDVRAAIERDESLDAGGVQGMALTLTVTLVGDGASGEEALDALDALELLVIAALDHQELIPDTMELQYSGTSEPVVEVTSTRPTATQSVSFVMGYRVVRGAHQTPV